MVLSKRKAQLARARQIFRARKTSLPVTNEVPGSNTSSQTNNDTTSTEELLRGVYGFFEESSLDYSSSDESNESSSDDTSSDDVESSSDDFKSSSDESDVEPLDGNAESNPFKIVPTLEWSEEAGKYLKRQYGVGSRSTRKRQRMHERELEQAASNTFNIVDLFKRQQDLGVSLKSTRSTEKSNPGPRSKKRIQPGEKNSALDDLNRLLKSKTAQIKKYGYILCPESDFDRRHRMVRSFLFQQKEKNGSRREMATAVAKDYNRRGHTGREIVKWEKEWIRSRKIPESRAGKHKASLSLLDDEATLCALRDFMKTQDEGIIKTMNRLNSPSETW
jgi:hypothetical protein